MALPKHQFDFIYENLGFSPGGGNENGVVWFPKENITDKQLLDLQKKADEVVKFLSVKFERR